LFSDVILAMKILFILTRADIILFFASKSVYNFYNTVSSSLLLFIILNSQTSKPRRLFYVFKQTVTLVRHLKQYSLSHKVLYWLRSERNMKQTVKVLSH
jgi:hypothetical protein